VHPYGEPEGWEGFNGLRLVAMRQMQAQGYGAWFGAFLARRMVSGLGVFGGGSGVVRFQSVDTHPAHRNKGLVYKASQYAREDLAAHTEVIVADQTGTAIRIYRSVGSAMQTPRSSCSAGSPANDAGTAGHGLTVGRNPG